MLEDEQKERKLIGKKGEKAIFSTITSSLLPVRIPTAVPLRVNLKRDFRCVPNYNRDSISTYIRLSSPQLARHTLPGSITGEAGRADPTLNRKSRCGGANSLRLPMSAHVGVSTNGNRPFSPHQALLALSGFSDAVL